MSLHTLLYTSEATHDFTEEDLATLLKRAREYNSEREITGMLLFHNGSFMQALEGTEQGIFSLLEDRIKPDDRHANIQLVFDAPINNRVFSDWSMGFNYLDDSKEAPVEGWSDFLKTGNFRDPIISEAPTLAQEIMTLFKDSKL